MGDDPGTTSFLDTGAFELSRWRDGRCGVGFPWAFLVV